MKRASSIPLLDKEVVLKTANLSNVEARFLVASYYDDQEKRKATDMQIRHLGDRKGEDSAIFLSYVGNVHADLEKAILDMLDKFSAASPIGRWARTQDGIGPVIAAGLLAHIDIKMCPTVGHIWSFAGLDPTKKWAKGKKRPFNAKLKQLCYHIGESFKKISNNPNSMYGSIYKSRKQLLVDRNEEGYNEERAKTFYTNSDYVRGFLKKGLLPPGNLDRQACNYAAKIFLSHFHVVMYWDYFKKAPPKPFSVGILGHAHEIPIPNLDLFPGLSEAYYGVPAKPTMVKPKPKLKRSKKAA